MRLVNSYYLLLQIVVLLCGAEVVTSCLRCFTTPADRASICHHAVSLGKMETVECLQALHRGFDPLTNTSIAFSQIYNIKNYLMSFEKEVKSINDLYFPPAWVDQFEKKMAEFVKGVQDRVARHPPAKCRPPCGLQKAARAFTCSQCAEEDCQLPVACPLEVINAIELEKTIIPCAGSFILPENLKVTWKYAKNIKATDLGYFKYLDTGDDLFILIEPTRVSHIGTYACELKDDEDDIILRKFYYLDVKRVKSQAGSMIEESFYINMGRKPPSKMEEEKEEEEKTIHVPSTMETITEFLHSNISYAIYAGVCFTLLTIVVVCLWRYALSVDWRDNKTKKHLPIHMDKKTAIRSQQQQTPEGQNENPSTLESTIINMP